MIVDGRERGDANLEADVGIIGGGASGLSIARALMDSGLRVVLVESDGRGRPFVQLWGHQQVHQERQNKRMG